MCRDRVACHSGLIDGRPTVRFTAFVPPTPMGCRWCGVAEREHAWRWVPSARVHQWVQPTRAQVNARLRAHLALVEQDRKTRRSVGKFLP